MDVGILACGPYFDSGGMVASLVIFLLIKPFAYFAFIRAYRFRVSRAIPMTNKQAVKLAALRAILGVTLIGGGAFIMSFYSSGRSLPISWLYLYVIRMAAWWFVGHWGAGIRGKRLVGWIVAGTLINVAFDGAVLAGLMAGWFFPLLIIAVISLFIYILNRLGKRPSLQARFSDDPLCKSCQYNLTGNLSGICPECGTPIDAALV